MRQYLNEMQGAEAGTRKKMKKSLDKLVTEVLQQPCFRVHYCIRSMQPIFMVLSQETSADADGSRIMEKVNQCISVGNTEQSDLVLGGKGEQPWDLMTVTFESITVKVMSSALFAYWVCEESAEHVPPTWKQYARAAVPETRPQYVVKALELLKVEQVSDFFATEPDVIQHGEQPSATVMEVSEQKQPELMELEEALEVQLEQESGMQETNAISEEKDISNFEEDDQGNESPDESGKELVTGLNLLSVAQQPVSQQLLALLTQKHKKELHSAREAVLIPKFIQFEGHELVDSGRFEYEVAIKARALNAGEQKAPAPKAPRLRRKKGEEIKEGAGGREFCAMAIKLNCGGQCWATISEGVKRWSRADKFCKKCNVFLHSACHYWYHEQYGGNTVAAWNTELQANEVARKNTRDFLKKEFRKVRVKLQSKKSVAQVVGAGAKEPEVSDAELLAAPTLGAQVEV